eukprot:1691836-Prymnesium_polylepis.2
MDEWLSTKVSDTNRKNCIRVLKKLTTGEGIKHKNKPGEVFMKGYRLDIEDDLVAMRLVAKVWLPYSGPFKLDKGNGWALNHPLSWFQKYKLAHIDKYRESLTMVGLALAHDRVEYHMFARLDNLDK